MTAGVIGCIVTPAQGNRIPDDAPWCADNGLGPRRDGTPGTGLPADKWLAWLTARVTDDTRPRCLFAVAPDVVGDAAATLAASLPWLPRIRDLGIPAAFVAQDGAEHPDHAPPWDDFDVLFVGGSTDWKLGPHAAALVAEARRRGKRTHMGRVNTGKRFRYADALGCDTADGTILAMFPTTGYRDVMAWVGQDALPV